ncbi:hypothetical protein [Kocuria rosea]|uniref:hypothetical protein n=1 Tax=Kocuria rosea TaxID=1275 RepID=UPI0011A5ED0A|nr:hypothetical protein [Kocuria rosea]
MALLMVFPLSLGLLGVVGEECVVPGFCVSSVGFPHDVELVIPERFVGHAGEVFVCAGVSVSAVSLFGKDFLKVLFKAYGRGGAYFHFAYSCSVVTQVNRGCVAAITRSPARLGIIARPLGFQAATGIVVPSANTATNG